MLIYEIEYKVILNKINYTKNIQEQIDALSGIFWLSIRKQITT